MSAVSNLTYVTWIDASGGTAPDVSTVPIAFSNYNDAMSYAKFVSSGNSNAIGNIWNYNGGSGNWFNGVFTARSNSNWP